MDATALYLPLEAADVEDFRAFAERLRLRGASVTAPYKQQVLAGLAAREPLVEQVGAANTLRACADGWHGRNTDVPGFLEPLEGRIALDGCRAAVLGGGGVARAAAVALAGCGARVTVCARNAEKAAGVAGLAGGEAAPLPPRAGSWDLLVNTTPVGTWPDVDATPLPGGPFDGGVVYDLVYNPARDAPDGGGPGRRLHGHRRPADAGGPGLPAVRMVDGDGRAGGRVPAGRRAPPGGDGGSRRGVT